jgi:hypothetical protein
MSKNKLSFIFLQKELCMGKEIRSNEREKKVFFVYLTRCPGTHNIYLLAHVKK